LPAKADPGMIPGQDRRAPRGLIDSHRFAQTKDREFVVMDDQTPRKKSFARRLLRVVVLVVLLTAVLVGALPWLLSTPPARRAVVAAVNRAVAPSKVGIGGLSVSWAGSIRVTGLWLRDKDGKTVLTARQAVLDRGLFPLILDRYKLGTLTVEGASADVERRADGSIDLVDALMPPRSPAAPAQAAAPAAEPAPAASARARPATELTVRVVKSAIKFQTPELAEPFTAEEADAEVVLPAAPGQKLTWRVRLAQPAGGTAAETLGIDGEYDHRAAEAPDLTVSVKGTGWPVAVKTSGAVGRGRLDGLMKASREAGRWVTTGDAKLLGFDASGPVLAGDRLDFDVEAAWDLDGANGAWTVRKFGVVCPVGSVSASGTVAAGDGKVAPDARVEGRVDLAALSKQIPHTLRLREGLTLVNGSARVLVQVKSEGAAQKATVEMNVSDLVARERQPARTFTLRDPADVTARATRAASGFSLETLSVKTAFLNLSGSGDLQKGVKLAGTVDLAKIEEQFHDLIDFGGVQLAGRGRMAADYRRNGPAGFLARYAAEFRGLKVAGLTTDPLVRDALRFDAASSGPAEPSGLPETWENVRVNLKSSQDAVTLATQSHKDGFTTLNGTASVPVTVRQRAGQADVKIVGRWKPGKDPKQDMGVVEFDELRLGLRPLDPALAAAGTLGFAARGWIDIDDDGLQLTPLPAPSPLVLAPEGLKLHGLRKTPTSARAGSGFFVGDVAAIEQALLVWTGREPTGLGGALAAQFGMGPGEGGRLNLSVSASVPDLSRLAPDGKGRKADGPLALAYLGTYDPALDRLNVGNFVAVTRYGRLDARGTLDEPTGRRLADLQGVLAPNWQAVSAAAAEMTEPKARLQGKDRAYRLKGLLSGDSLAAVLKGLDAEIGVELTSADVLGLNLGPAPLVVRCKAGAFAVDPIKTTMNNGAVDLKPGLAVDEAQGISLLLAKGSKMEGVEINDEVSRDLLSYIAPVLDKATHVHGKVSLAVDRADIPLTGPPTHKVSMTGQLVFQDVIFAPGPFANQVLGLVGKPNEPGLRLHQPVQLTVADGRVYQRGLSVPIAPNAAVSLDGSVGFDESLDMKANVPITKGMLGSAAGLDDLVGDGKITVPIEGTVSHPRINKQALQVAVRELARNVIKRDVSREASRFLDKLGPAPDAKGGAGAGPGGIPTDLKGLENQLLRRVLPGGRKP